MGYVITANHFLFTKTAVFSSDGGWTACSQSPWATSSPPSISYSRKLQDSATMEAKSMDSAIHSLFTETAVFSSDGGKEHGERAANHHWLRHHRHSFPIHFTPHGN
mmetsp:Transcript_152219/g.369671  ORF Transcript_152219/g.369671 Transcript_152219/m.369671 type:complete len:106 (+) Transcript_152219:174-491(+)